MNLIRFAARTMLASYFVINGAKSIANPAPLVGAAQPLADKYLPKLRSAAPEQVSSFIPTDAKTLIRVNGAMQVAGGLGLAMGACRRPSAALLALALVPHVVASNPLKGVDSADRERRRQVVMKNVALLGGALLASQDTEGAPGLGWRAQQKRIAAIKATDGVHAAANSRAVALRKDATKSARALRKDATKSAKALRKDATKSARTFRKDVLKRFRAARQTISEALPSNS